MRQLKEALFVEHEGKEKIEGEESPSFEVEAVEKNKLLHERLDDLLKLMVDQQQGCIRFEFGRDWSLVPGKFDTLEQAKNLRKVPYGFQLKGKRSLFRALLLPENQACLLDIAASKLHQPATA